MGIQAMCWDCVQAQMGRIAGWPKLMVMLITILELFWLCWDIQMGFPG